MAKLVITKRKRSIGEHIDSLVKSAKGFPLWWNRMTGSWVYREVFQAAFWGEAAEYEVRFSSLTGVFYCFLGIAGIIYLHDTRYKGWPLFLWVALFVGFFIIGLRQFKDLQGPIWWADRFAVRAHSDYQQTGRFRRYNRYGAYFRDQVQAYAPPVKVEEMAFLCELYHQLCTGTISQNALCELGLYTAQDINYFYQFFDIRQSDPQFPVNYIGYRLQRQP